MIIIMIIITIRTSMIIAITAIIITLIATTIIISSLKGSWSRRKRASGIRPGRRGSRRTTNCLAANTPNTYNTNTNINPDTDTNTSNNSSVVNKCM